MERLTIKNNAPFGFSLPKDLIELIDRERGDISRSKYVLRLIEKSLCNTNNDKKHNKKNSLPIALDGGHHSCKTRGNSN